MRRHADAFCQHVLKLKMTMSKYNLDSKIRLVLYCAVLCCAVLRRHMDDGNETMYVWFSLFTWYREITDLAICVFRWSVLLQSFNREEHYSSTMQGEMDGMNCPHRQVLHSTTDNQHALSLLA